MTRHIYMRQSLIQNANNPDARGQVDIIKVRRVNVSCEVLIQPLPLGLSSNQWCSCPNQRLFKSQSVLFVFDKFRQGFFNTMFICEAVFLVGLFLRSGYFLCQASAFSAVSLKNASVRNLFAISFDRDITIDVVWVVLFRGPVWDFLPHQGCRGWCVLHDG